MFDELIGNLKSKVILPVVSVGAIGSAGWLTQMHFTSLATANTVTEMVGEIKDMKNELTHYKIDNQEKLFLKLSDIEKRLSRIEGKLN